MSLVEVPPVDPVLLDEIQRDADAIEFAMAEQRLFSLGLRTDEEVRAEIEVSLQFARTLLPDSPRAMAALAAADYMDDPMRFIARRRSALWRSCELHDAQWLWWALTGDDPRTRPAPRIPAVDELAEALLAESAGPGLDGGL